MGKACTSFGMNFLSHYHAVEEPGRDKRNLTASGKRGKHTRECQRKHREHLIWNQRISTRN
jgi:hypothetical protein